MMKTNKFEYSRPAMSVVVLGVSDVVRTSTEKGDTDRPFPTFDPASVQDSGLSAGPTA